MSKPALGMQYKKVWSGCPDLRLIYHWYNFDGKMITRHDPAYYLAIKMCFIQQDSAIKWELDSLVHPM